MTMLISEMWRKKRETSSETVCRLLFWRQVPVLTNHSLVETERSALNVHPYAATSLHTPINMKFIIERTASLSWWYHSQIVVCVSAAKEYWLLHSICKLLDLDVVLILLQRFDFDLFSAWPTKIESLVPFWVLVGLRWRGFCHHNPTVSDCVMLNSTQKDMSLFYGVISRCYGPCIHFEVNA